MKKLMNFGQEYVRISKFLSLVLRHKPEEIGLTLDKNGWANVDELIEKSNISFEVLQEVVSTNDKKRFAFNEDESKIRASQGHSIDVDLNLKPRIPPDVLYHGTAEKFLSSIYQQGLVKGRRHAVHLSHDIETAIKVGKRHGIPVVLKVNSGKMYEDGYIFFLSENGVWLTDHVLNIYLDRVFI